MEKKEVLELVKKTSVYFGVRTFFRVAHATKEDQFWILTGGRRGHLGVWKANFTDGAFSLDLHKIVEPIGQTDQGVIVQFLMAPPEFSCWDPAKRKQRHIEIFVLVLGRRELHKGSTLFSLQFDCKTGKTHTTSSRLEFFAGENSQANSMCFWNGHIVIGMGQQLSYIGPYQEGNTSILTWEYECPAKIEHLCIMPGNNGNEERFLVLGCSDKVRWYRNRDSDFQSIVKAHSVKAHSTRTSTMLGVKNILYTAGGGADSTIKSWKTPDACEVNEDDKREKGLIKTYQGHSDAINSLAFIGEYLVSGSARGDASLRVWGIDNEFCYQARITPHKAIHAILPINDKIVLTGGTGGANKLCIWALPSATLDISLSTTAGCVLQ